MEKSQIKFIRRNCKTPMAHVRLFRYENGDLELWHYSSNVCAIVNGILELRHNYDYGTYTRMLMNDFTTQYNVHGQYLELLLPYETR